jgi:putative ABC transport system ATP-binding protein
MINLWNLDGKIKAGKPFLSNLREMVQPEKTFIKLIIINSIAISFLSLILPVSVQSIITNLGVLNVTQPIMVMTLVLFVILIFSGGIQVIQSYTIEVLRRRLFIRFGAEILNHSTRYLDSHFQAVNRPQLAKKYTDVLFAQVSMVTFFVDGIGFGVQYFISMGLLCLYHPYFLIFAILITFMLWCSWSFFGPNGVKAGRPESDSRYMAMGWMDEILRARPLFMSSSGRKFAEKKFVSLLGDWNLKRNNLFNQQFAQTISLQFFNAFVYSSLLGIGYLLVKKGELSVGQLVAAFIVVTMLLSSLPRLQNFFLSIYDYSTNIDNLAEFWSHPVEEERELHHLQQGPMNFSFNKTEYPENVCLNLTLRPGEKVYAYVRSFAAARTLVKALEGFLPPMKGDMLIDGLRWDDLNFSQHRERLAVIGIGRFFSGSVRENMTAFSNKPISITEIEDALERVGLLEKIKSLPMGIDDQILPNGYPLSLSESIALQVARALVMKPDLIIMTNDFDKMSHLRRKAVKQVLLDSSHPWTILFLSQRLLKASFSRYLILDRHDSIEIKNEDEILEEIEKDE